MAESVGQFGDPVQVEWLREPGETYYRNMRLLRDFVFIDPDRKVWTAQKNFETDGASIPRAAWTLAGGPFDGQYREAAVIHDQYCFLKTETWQATHRVFYAGMIASGVSELIAKTFYGVVMVGGPRWGDGIPAVVPDAMIDAVSIKLDHMARPTKLREVSEAEATVLRDWVAANNPSLDQIDAHVATTFPELRPGQ
jgi:hypothetical protein